MLLAILLSAATPSPPGWARFERVSSLDGKADRVEIMTDGSDPVSHDITIKLRDIRSTVRGDTTLWADSRHCPAIRDMLVNMRDIEMPRPAPYGVPGDTGIRWTDGIGYSLTAPSSFSNGDLTISSNIGSPLAQWVDGALKALEPCWSPTERPR